MNGGNNDIVGDDDLLWCIYVQHFPINLHHRPTLTHRGFKIFALGLTSLAPCSFYERSGKQSNLGKPSQEKISLFYLIISSLIITSILYPSKLFICRKLPPCNINLGLSHNCDYQRLIGQWVASSSHKCQSNMLVTTVCHNCFSQMSVKNVSQNIRKNVSKNCQSKPSITAVNHNCQSQDQKSNVKARLDLFV